MITIEFTTGPMDTEATLYKVTFRGSYPVRVYDLKPNEVNQLVLPISQDNRDFRGCDGGSFILIGTGKRKSRTEVQLDKSKCTVVNG